ncbi:hypothetical protein [Cyanobium sp. ULC065]
MLLTGGPPAAGVMATASRGGAWVDGHLVVGVLPDEGMVTTGKARRSWIWPCSPAWERPAT